MVSTNVRSDGGDATALAAALEQLRELAQRHDAVLKEVEELRRQMAVRQTPSTEDTLRLQSLVLNQIEDMVTVTDLVGTITYVNHAACRALQRPAEDLVGRSVHSYGEDPARGATQQQIIDETLRTGHWRGEVVNVAADGTPHLLDCRTSLVRGESGCPVAMCGIATDITDRRAAEEALQRNRAELQAIYDSAPVMMCVVDASRCVQYANRALAEFVGQPEAALVAGRTCGVFGCIRALDDPRGCGFGPKCDDCGLRAALRDTFATGARHRGVEYRTTLVDGRLSRDVVLLGSTALISTGGPPLALLCLEDITERKRDEQALRDTETQLTAALEAGGLGWYESRVDRNEVILDDRARSILGVPFDLEPQRVFEFWAERIHPEDRAEVLAVSQKLRSGALGRVSAEYRYRHQEGDWRWISHSSRIRPDDSSGQSLRLVGTLHDITERKRAEDQIRALSLLPLRNPAPVVRVDGQGVVLLANPAAESLGARLGLPIGEWLVGLRDVDLPQLIGLGATVEREVRLADRVIQFAIRGESDPGFATFYGADVTERQRAEATVQRAGQLARATIDALPALICVLDETGTVITLNFAWQNAAGDDPPPPPGVHLGANYLDLCDAAGGAVATLAGGIRDVMADARNEFVLEYSCQAAATTSWFVGRVTRFGDPGARRVVVTHENITRRKCDEEERAVGAELLRLLTVTDSRDELMHAVLELLERWSGCEAIGVRLREGDDFPYFEARGFPRRFVAMENRLCSVDEHGQPLRDGQGHPVLECMCGNVLSGRFDPAQPFFTARGSFWTNSTTALLASTTEADRQARARNRCHGEGYESVALIPLRSGAETFGLLQLNDHRPGRLTPETIDFLERVAARLALVLGRQRAVAALAENERRLRMALDAGHSGTWDWNMATGHIVWSGGHEMLWGMLPGSFKGTFAEFERRVHPDDRPALTAIMRRTAEERGAVNEEFRVVWPDGSLHWVRARGDLSFDAEGKPARMVGIVAEVTERRLAEESLRTSRDQLRVLAGRLETVREEERAAVARQIHDVLAQELTRLKLDIVWLHGRLTKRPVRARGAVPARLAEMTKTVDVAIKSVQRLATELRPSVLDSLGLVAAIDWHLRDFQKRTRIQCHVDLPAEELAVDPRVATAVYRILQESLTNVVRHAAASHVDVAVRQDDGMLVLRVGDDGCGAPPGVLASPQSIGLAGMRERALLLGGQFEMTSHPGAGTTIEVRLGLGRGSD